VLAAVSLLYPSSPGYDPWAWIIWGREVADLDLSTEKGPSWKPLPVLFTTVFSYAGEAAPALWLLVARTGGLLTLAMAFRVAARLAGTTRILAGVVAAIGVVLIEGFLPLVARGWSEPLLAASVLVAVERHLDGARGTAFGALFVAALIRPEVWPFLALYGVYVWRREPTRRAPVAVLLLLVPVLWYGPELVATGDALRSQARAQRPLPGRPGLFEDAALEVLRQGAGLVFPLVQALAALAFAVAAIGFARRRTGAVTLVLAVGCVAWVAIVAAMAELGYSGNPRYLVPVAVVVCVLAGVGAVRVVGAARVAVERIRKRPVRGLPVAVSAAVALVAALVLAARPGVERLHAGDERIRAQAEISADLPDAVRLAGGRERVLACGRVFTGPFEFPVVAWTLRLHMRELSTTPRAPGAFFRARPTGHGSATASPPRVAGGFRLVARTPLWDVLTACRRSPLRRR
jgi:hypothetical protein